MKPWDWIIVIGAVFMILLVGLGLAVYFKAETYWRHIDDTIRGDEP